MSLSPLRKSQIPHVLECDALASLPVPVLLVDASGRVTSANAQARDLLGCGAKPDVGLSSFLLTNGITGTIDLARSTVLAAGARLRLCDGRILSARLGERGSEGWSLVLENISEVVSRDTQIDPVTLLIGRQGLQDAVAQAIDANLCPSILAIGLKGFRRVNDALGREIGDALLRRVAERLQSLGDAGDLVARSGDGEFLVLPGRAIDGAAVRKLAERIVDILGRAYAIDGQMINVTADVGVAQAETFSVSAAMLLKHAELSLADAKAVGGGISFFEPAFAARVETRRQLELDLRRAMALKQLELFYQPQIDLRSGAIAGFEALLRWRREDGSFISPADFVPIAEETGLIVPIGDWVLRTACAAAARWHQPVSVAVNLSPIQFQNPGIAQTVISALAHSGLAPERLELEITEGALLDDTDVVVSTLQTLRSVGVRVSMDDFGTGYSSLSYLRKFPFDKIKIDQSFVRELEADEDARVIMRTIAALGGCLGMLVTAEGVETEAQLEEVRKQGCDYVQGFLTGRPMDAEAAAKLIACEDVLEDD